MKKVLLEPENCTSCGALLVGTGFTRFPCPDCSEAIIGRCKDCRKNSKRYICPKCSFTGP